MEKQIDSKNSDSKTIEEEQRIIDFISNIKNTKCKTLLIDGINIIPKENKIITFCHTKEDVACIYDEETKIISQIPRIKIKRYSYSSVILPTGNIIFFGGCKKGDASSSCELFNAESNLFTKIGEMNEERNNSNAILLRNGFVLIIGGHRDYYYKVLDSCELFNPMTQNFSYLKQK